MAEDKRRPKTETFRQDFRKVWKWACVFWLVFAILGGWRPLVGLYIAIRTRQSDEIIWGQAGRETGGIIGLLGFGAISALPIVLVQRASKKRKLSKHEEEGHEATEESQETRPPG